MHNLEPIHSKLVKTYPWYAAWHVLPFISYAHFVILFGAGSFLALAIQAQALDSVNPNIVLVSPVAEGENVPGRLIVQFKGGVGHSDKDKDLQDAHAHITHTISQIGAEVLEVPKGEEGRALDMLKHNPRIAYAEYDGILTPTAIPNDPSYPNQWALQKIAAPAGWEVTTGSSNVTVAVLDSGVDSTHPDLAQNLVTGHNFISNSSNTGADAACGHGTKVAGTVAEVGNNAEGGSGVSWNSKIMPLVIADGTTSCSTYWSTVASAITYAVDHGARIINISYAGTADSSTMQNAVNYAWNKGVIVFASAANSNTNVLYYPAAEANVVGVSATDENDSRAYFSNYGSYIDLGAPGTNIFTTTNGGGYATVSGTSFSSPISAGLAALVFSINPSLSGSQVVSLMEDNSDDLGAPGWDEVYGWGRINIEKTLLAAQTSTPTLDSTVPNTTITMPLNGATVSAGISVDVSATDNVGVTKVELLRDGSVVATDTAAPYSFFWDTTISADGSHTLIAKAYDTAGNVGSSASVTAVVSNVVATPPAPTPTPSPNPDTTPPTVVINSPANGIKVRPNGNLTISVSGSDAGGMKSISIKVDTTTLATCTGATACSTNWKLNGVKAGTHSITATAVDSAGNTSSASITVLK